MKDIKTRLFKVAILGSSQADHLRVEGMCNELGKQLINNKYIIVTGMSRGVPQMVVEGAKNPSAIIEGLSPHKSKEHHVRFGDQLNGFTSIEYLNSSVKDIVDRFSINARRIVQTADMFIIIGGSRNTQIEMYEAIDSGKPVFIMGNVPGSGVESMQNMLANHEMPTNVIIVGSIKILIELIKQFT